MELIRALLSIGIAGYNMKTYEQIVNHDSTAEILMDSPSAGILLSTGYTIKCVKNYYTKDGEFPPKATSVNQCFSITKFYGIHDSHRCTQCHKQCLEKFKAKELKLAQQKIR